MIRRITIEIDEDHLATAIAVIEASFDEIESQEEALALEKLLEQLEEK